MKNRKLWCALVSALLCLALLCPAFALAEVEDLSVDDTVDEALALEMNEAFDGDLPDLPDLDLPSNLALNDLTLDGDLTAAEPEAILLGGSDLSNDGEAQEAPPPEEVVTLVASYTGEPLTKVYDCTKLGAGRKQNDDGTYEIVYYIEALKTIKSQFQLTPASGQSLVEGHRNVSFSLTLSKQFDAADVGRYNFEFTLALTGEDAAWYTIENPVVSVPATITPCEVTVSPRQNLVKSYGDADPVYPSGTTFTLKYTNGEVAVSQDVAGVPTYGVPTFTSDQMAAVKTLILESKITGRNFFPGFLGRKAGEKPGKYRVTKGTLDYGSNFRLKVAEGYFIINRRDINDSDITVKAISDKAYTGKAIKPKPTVRFKGKKLKLNTDYTLKYSNSKGPGNAAVTIKGKGNFTGTRKLTFRIILKPTAISKLTAGQGQITVAWKKGKLNHGYEIAYGTDAEFTDARTKTVKGIRVTRATLKKLESKTTYYVRIRTFRKVRGNVYYSAWSRAKSIRTK